MSRRPLLAVAVVAVAAIGCSLVVDTSGLADGIPGDAGSMMDGTTDDHAVVSTDAGTDAPVSCPPSVDLSTDSAHCGRCGHDCLGGACVAARCQPVVIISGETKAAGVGTDGVELFWSTFDGAVRARGLDGGAIRMVAKLASAGHVEVDATYVYTADRTGRQIVRIHKVSGQVERIATCAGECLGVAVDGTSVYFTDRGTSTLRLVDADGGSSAVATGLNNPEDAFATATDVFVANESAGNIVRVPRDGSGSSTFLTIADPVAVAIEGADEFFVSQSPGIIYRRPVSGGNLDLIASGQSGPVGLLATPKAVYWASIADGTIVRVAR